MNNEAKIFRDYLSVALKEKAAMNEGQISGILARYDAGVNSKKYSPELTFVSLWDSFGSGESVACALANARSILEGLQEINQKTVSNNKVERIERSIKNLKANLRKMDIEIVGDGRPLEPHQLAGLEEIKREKEELLNQEAPKIAVNPDGTLARPFYYTLIANYKDEEIDFGVTWTL